MMFIILAIQCKPLNLMINKIKGHFEEIDGDKYLIISSENSDICKNIKKFLME